MRAATWQGRRDVRVERVPDPLIQEAALAIVGVTHLPLVVVLTP